MSDGTVQDVFDDNPSRLVLSGGEQGARETLRRFAQGYQSERIVSNQAFHRNFSTAEAVQYVTGLLGTAYRQLNAWGEKYEYNLKVAKRGRLMFSRKLRKEGGGQSAALEHNRVKKYLLPEGGNRSPAGGYRGVHP